MEQMKMVDMGQAREVEREQMKSREEATRGGLEQLMLIIRYKC